MGCDSDGSSRITCGVMCGVRMGGGNSPPAQSQIGQQRSTGLEGEKSELTKILWFYFLFVRKGITDLFALLTDLPRGVSTM